jgi:hypothetical protein
MTTDFASTLDVHRFRIGSTVHLCRNFPTRNAAAGGYAVLAHIPVRDGEPQYRIKNYSEPYQRTVRESEIEPMQTDREDAGSSPPAGLASQAGGHLS